MHENTDYIKLSRNLLDWDLFWEEHSVMQLWIYILLMANSRDRVFGDRVIKRGQHLTTYRRIEDESGWSHHTISKYMNKLVKRGCITISSDKKRGSGGTLITVCNYDAYQCCVATDATQTATQTATQITTNGICTENFATQTQKNDLCVATDATEIATQTATKQEYIYTTTITTTNGAHVRKTWMQDKIDEWRHDDNFKYGLSQELMIPTEVIEAAIDTFSIKIDNERYDEAQNERDLIKYFKNCLRRDKRERESNNGNQRCSTARTDKQAEHDKLVRRASELFARSGSQCGEVPF